jgi:hypothetical protein
MRDVAKTNTKPDTTTALTALFIPSSLLIEINKNQATVTCRCGTEHKAISKTVHESVCP